MVKLVSPFGSKRVSGRIGDGFVMASWRGIPYLRQRVIPAYRTSERLERVRGLFAQQNRRWMELREAEREAWRMFCERRHLLGQANVVFASYSSLALDAGLPEPVLPPLSKAPQAPKLRIQLEGEGLIISRSFPRLTSHWSCRLVVLVRALLAQSPSALSQAPGVSSAFRGTVSVPAEEASLYLRPQVPGFPDKILLPRSCYPSRFQSQRLLHSFPDLRVIGLRTAQAG